MYILHFVTVEYPSNILKIMDVVGNINKVYLVKITLCFLASSTKDI